MNNLNRCEFIGHLGQDPEMRSTRDGDSVASISIACNWKTKNNEGTEWIPCVAFGRLAEVIEDYLQKGSKVYVSGNFKTEMVEDRDGNRKYYTKIVIRDLEMLDSKRDDDDREYGKRSRRDRGDDDNRDRNQTRRRSKRSRNRNDDRDDRNRRSRDAQEPSHTQSNFEDDDIPF